MNSFCDHHDGPVLIVKYKDKLIKFKNLIDYDNWVKFDPDRENFDIMTDKILT